MNDPNQTPEPSPTPWAYEAACKALEKHRARADKAEAERDRLKAAMEKLAADFETGTNGIQLLGQEVRNRLAAALSGNEKLHGG